MNDRIRNLISIERLVEAPAHDDEVAGIWQNALTAFRDASLESLSLDGRVVRAFDAGRMAAHAIVRAHSYRVRATNHHEMTIAVAGILGGDELNEELQQFEATRTVRSQFEYGWQQALSESDLLNTIANVRKVIQLGAAVLKEQRPHIAGKINTPD